MKRLLWLVPLVLVGCSSTKAPTPQAQMAALEVTIVSAIGAANKCLDQRLGPCGQKATRADIIANEHRVIDAYRNARDATGKSNQAALIAVANEALAQLSNQVPKGQ